MELLKANYEYGGFTYLVYSNGDIYSPTGKKLKHRKNDDGYAVVTMGNEYSGCGVPSIRTMIPPVHAMDTMYICSQSYYSKWGLCINDKGYRLH